MAWNIGYIIYFGHYRWAKWAKSWAKKEGPPKEPNNITQLEAKSNELTHYSISFFRWLRNVLDCY